MKRAIIGLGVGAMILLCWTTSPQAFDRDITLPSPNQSDPVWIYNSDGEDGGWEEPLRSGNTNTNDDRLSSRFRSALRFVVSSNIFWQFLLSDAFEAELKAGCPAQRVDLWRTSRRVGIHSPGPIK